MQRQLQHGQLVAQLEQLRLHQRQRLQRLLPLLPPPRLHQWRPRSLPSARGAGPHPAQLLQLLHRHLQRLQDLLQHCHPARHQLSLHFSVAPLPQLLQPPLPRLPRLPLQLLRLLPLLRLRLHLQQVHHQCRSRSAGHLRPPLQAARRPPPRLRPALLHAPLHRPLQRQLLARSEATTCNRTIHLNCRSQ